MPLDDTTKPTEDLAGENPFAQWAPKPEAAAPQLEGENPFAQWAPPKPEAAEQPKPPETQPEDTGLTGAFTSGLMHGIRGPIETARSITGERPAPPAPPKTVAEQPVELGDLVHPYRLGEKLLYQTASSAPALGAGIAAGAAATPAGPFAQLGAGALAFGVTSAVQQLGPVFGEELSKNAQDPDGAWNRALGKAAETGAFGSLGWAAFAVAPFAGAVKNLLFQAFVAQPSLGMAEQATQNLQEGRPATEGLGNAYAGAVAGTAIPILGVEGARYIGHRIAGSTEPQATQTTTPSAAAEPAAPQEAPPPGTRVGVADLSGNTPPADMTVNRYSPDGKIAYLVDQDENVHPMATADLLPRIVELPHEEAEQTPPTTPETVAEEPAVVLPAEPAEAPITPDAADEQQRQKLVETSTQAVAESEVQVDAIGDSIDNLFQEHPEAPPAAEPTPAPEGIPFMITAAMRRDLGALGHSPEEIRNMTPSQAHEILSAAAAPEAAPVSPEAAPVADQIAAAHQEIVDQTKAAMTPPAPEPSTEPAPGSRGLDVPEAAASFDLGGHFFDHFSNGNGFASIVEARNFARDLGFNPDAPGARKVLDEAIEDGVTRAAQQVVQEGRADNASPGETFAALADLYQRQPILGERTADSRRRQAYSTPAPLAYLASRLADISPEKTVYEPTAGNGMLLLDTDPRKVIANEIDPGRRAVLQTRGYPDVRGEDATVHEPPAKSVDTVIANPPFGKVKDDRGNAQSFQTPWYRTQDVDHAIALQALKAMKDDGTAVLILGGKKVIGANQEAKLKDAYNTQASRGFFKALYDNYNVTDHFTVSGDLYNRSGAAWPIDVVQINGRGKSALPLPGVRPPRRYDSFDQLRELIDAHGSVGAPGYESRPDIGGSAVGAQPGLGGVPGAAEPTPTPAYPEGRPGPGGRGYPSPGPSGVPGIEPRIPEPMGAPAPGGGGRGGELEPGIRPVAGEGVQPSGPEGAGGSRPGDVAQPSPAAGTRGLNNAELGDLLKGAFDDLYGPEPGAAPTDVQRTPSVVPAASAPQHEPRLTGTPQTREGQLSNETAQAIRDALLREETPRRFDLDPGVDPERYTRLQSPLLKAIEELGIKGDADPATLIRGIVTALRDNFKFSREEAQQLTPYLLQLTKDIGNGRIELGGEVSRRRANEEVETNLQVHYTPSSNAEPVGTLVPVNMQDAINRSLTSLKDRVGDLDQFVAGKLGFTRDQIVGTTEHPGIFSAEQVDAAAMAIDNLDRGAGFIIGDQTGVGKGRFVAAMMRYAQQQGKTPIFVTASPGLYADMYRDLRDIGMHDFKALVTNNDLRGKARIPLGENEFLESLPQGQQNRVFREIMETGQLPEGYDALFTNYSQMQFGKGGAQYPRHSVMERLAPNALLVLDESHEAGGTETKKFDPDTGKELPTRADFARQLINDSSGAIYSSATYAKNPHVMSLYFKTDMPLAVDKLDELAPLIKEGGVPLQQVVANMLIEAGQYARRERSYDGVDFAMKTTPVDLEAAETASSQLRNIFNIDTQMTPVREAFGDELAHSGEGAGQDNAIGHAGASSTEFSSIMHNVISQSLLALKADQAAKEAIGAWKNGEKPIIALSNTFGSLLDRYVGENHLAAGADMSDLTFNRVFENYLDRTRTVTIKDPHDPSNNVRHYITDEEMDKLGFGHLVGDFDNLKQTIRDTDLGNMPGSPLDYMLDQMRAAGMRVGEITGRGKVIEGGVLAPRDSSGAAKKQIMNAFNNGDLDALLINRSGSTGFSLHASEKYADQNQRHMIMLQADPNIDTFMQILGRIHRTGQVVLPKYSLLMSELPAEKRPAAVLMRKLGSLNANTSANRESAVGLRNVTDMMNTYGDEVAADMLESDHTLQDRLGIHPKTDGTWGDGVMAKMTGRLAIMPIAEQEHIWGQVEKNYHDLIDALDRVGRNTLEAKTMDLDAQTKGEQPVTEDRGAYSPFAKPAILKSVNVKRLGKPYTADEVQARTEQITGGDPDANQQKLHADLQERSNQFADGLRGDLDKAQGSLAALREQQATVDAASPEGKKLGSAIGKLERRAQLLNDRVTRAEAQQREIQDFLDSRTPGRALSVRVGTGDDVEHFSGVMLGVTTSGRGTPTPSNYVAHVAIADGARELKIPLSKISTPSAERRFDLGIGSPSQVRHDFESGQTVSREDRHIVTGNLLAGYNAFRGKGQIVMYRDDQGQINPGILLPRGFDPQRALAERPVVLAPDQALRFLDEAIAGRDRIIQSDDGNLSIQKDPDTPGYLLKAKAKGGGPYWKPRAVNDILGEANQFHDRKGKTVNATTPDRATAEQILKWYEDNLDTRFHANADKDAARQIVEEGRPSVAEERGRPGMWERFAANIPEARDTLPEATQFRGGYATDPTAAHAAARDYVLAQGRGDNNEHFATVDHNGDIMHSGTSDMPDAIRFSPALTRELEDPAATPVAFHHNHPSDNGVSGPDMMMLAAPGIGSISAHTHSGDVSSASLTERARAVVEALSPREGQEYIGEQVKAAADLIGKVIQPLVERKILSDDRASQLFNEARNRLLAASGLIDYVSTRELPTWLHNQIVRATKNIEGGDLSDRFHRSAGALRPEEAMARISDAHADLTTGRPTSPVGGRPGEGGIGERPRAEPAFAGLAEETPDVSQRATEEATEQAGNPNDRGYFGRLLDNLGIGPKSPGARWHEFGIVNKNFTTFFGKGDRDPLFAPKVNAERQKLADYTAFLNSYHDSMPTWKGKPPALWNKVFSAAELLTLEGRQVPLDGRAVVVENVDRPLAGLSKPGDIISLETPDEIRMFTELRQTMDKVWGDVVEQTAKRFGWEGEPTSAAMLEAARQAPDIAQRQRMERAARIVAAVEYQARNSYLPLMRDGDYYLRVTPKAGTEAKPGIPGWDGAPGGFAPTVAFHLIESRTPLERFMGGMREGTPKTAVSKLEELRAQFPEDEYNIDHGFLSKPEETIRDLDIPAVEKLMMLVGNDTRGIIRDRLSREGATPDSAREGAQSVYDKLMDTVLDQIVESRVIGPRKTRQGIPGYSADFANSVGTYLNWMAHHVANIKNGEAIDRANSIIYGGEGEKGHPDPLTVQYARDWDRRQEDFGDPMYGPLMKMRQGAFYWFLGASVASTIKILLHGPLLGVPTLTTGLGAIGRSRAAGDYLKAIKELMPGFTLDGHGLGVDIKRGASGAELAFLDRAEAEGYAHPHGMDELAAAARGGEEQLSPQQRTWQRVLDIWGSNISAADRLIRGAMLRSSYRIANREGMDAINRVWDKNESWKAMPEKTPETWAKFMTDRSVGLWGNFNKMPVLRSQMGGMIGQFRNYEILWLSNLYRQSTQMGPEGKITAALMLGGLASLGGAVALPFIQDAEKAAEFVYGMITGIEPDIQNTLKRAADAQFGNDSGVGEAVLHGPRPFGIDWGSIGFGDLASRMGKTPLDMLGAAVSAAVGTPYRAFQRYHTDQGLAATTYEMMPNSVKHMVSAFYPSVALSSAATGFKSMAPEQLSDADRVKMGLGLMPASRAVPREEHEHQMRARANYEASLKLLENRYVNLTARGEPTASVEQQLEKTLGDGVAAGVLTQREKQLMHARFMSGIQNRLHPEIPTKSAIRWQQGQAATP